MTPEPTPPPGDHDEHREPADDVVSNFKTREDGIREEIRQELSLREQRLRMNSLRDEEEARQRFENRLRARVIREEEEKFFAAKGYVRYLNRYGQTEWIAPEEASRRKVWRRKEFLRNLFFGQGRRRLKKWGIAVAILAASLVTSYAVWRSVRHGPTQYGAVVVQTEIPGAQIYIDGVATDSLTPHRVPDLSEGPHSITVFKDGYVAKPPTCQLTIVGNQEKLAKFELSSIPVLGKVVIETSLTVDFQLYIDGFLYPLDDKRQAMIPVGYHVFSVVKPGYLAKPSSRRLLVTHDEVCRAAFEFVPENSLGYLKITREASEGYVYLNGAFTGFRTNEVCIPLRSGTYEVTVHQNGRQYFPAKQDVDILPGKTHTLSFESQPVERSQRITLRTDTPGANIVLDGEWLPFVTPCADLALSPGPHYLNLVRDGRLYNENDILVAPERKDDTSLTYDF